MSGFIVGYGEPNRQEVRKMFEKIKHRGPKIAGDWERGRVIMAQNYLEADIAPAAKELMKIPIGAPENDEFRICMDSQFGDAQALAREHDVAGGSFLEERLTMHLYRQYGAKMFQYLKDAIFTFAISDGEKLIAARDLLGIKTLFYGFKGNTVYLASELKALVAVTDQVYEFPPGYYMDEHGELICFAELPQVAPEITHKEINQITAEVRGIIEKSIESRIDFARPTAALLSGGMDSSVITYLASARYKREFGAEAKLKTFAIGLSESGDIENARTMAEHVGTEHHELLVELDEVLDALPEVIYHLESFDPSLVRSAVSNYLITKHAREQGIEVLLSGEGGDEVFCGYSHLEETPRDELFERQIQCLGYLHNNASLRLDRMNQSHSMRVVAPLISEELLDYALSIPPEYKMKSEGKQKIEKWIFRKAYESLLPDSITWRFKQEFSQGSGSAAELPNYFERTISDAELDAAQEQHSMIRSKEELYYFKIFTEHFGAARAVDTVGQWLAI